MAAFASSPPLLEEQRSAGSLMSRWREEEQWGGEGELGRRGRRGEVRRTIVSLFEVGYS